MKSIKILLLLSVLSFFSCQKEEEITVDIPDQITSADQLDQVLEDILIAYDVPGFAVSIVKDGALAYQNGFGFSNITSGKAYTAESIQPIASVSKTFIAAATVKAISEGHFTLETPINELLPFSVVNPKVSGEILVKHLVSHTSGLIDEDEFYMNSYHILPGEDISAKGAQLVIDLFGIEQRVSVPLGDYVKSYYDPSGAHYSWDNFASSAPGESWNYSNIASSLIAYIIEYQTETPFDQYVKEKLLQPLSMNSTSYVASAQNTDLYWDLETPLPLYGNDSYPDGSIYTNHEDMSNYLINMLQGARNETSLLFPKESYQLLFDPLLQAGQLPAILGDNQGVFWQTDVSGTIRHDGGDPGVVTQLEFNVDANAGFYFSTNLDSSSDDNEEKFFSFLLTVGQAINAYINN